MKQLLFIFLSLMLATEPSSAKPQPTLPDVPPNAVLLIDKVYTAKNPADALTINNFQTHCESTVARVNNLCSDPEVRDALEFECSKVTYIKNTNFIIKYDRAFYFPTMSLQVYCEPRDLASKQLYTAYKECEAKPQEYCWSESFLKQLQEFKPTEYKTIWKTQCSEAAQEAIKRIGR